MQKNFPKKSTRKSGTRKPSARKTTSRKGPLDLMEVSTSAYHDVTRKMLELATQLTLLTYLLDRIDDDTTLESDKCRDLINGVATLVRTRHDEAEEIYGDLDALLVSKGAAA